MIDVLCGLSEAFGMGIGPWTCMGIRKVNELSKKDTNIKRLELS